MDCPRCKLINPSTALRCDCGYDFESKSVKKPYFVQELPRGIPTYIVLVMVCNLISILFLTKSVDVLRLVSMVVWMAFVYWCYLKLVQKKNWARITLIILTFPIGLVLLGSEVRLYCLQSNT